MRPSKRAQCVPPHLSQQLFSARIACLHLHRPHTHTRTETRPWVRHGQWIPHYSRNFTVEPSSVHLRVSPQLYVHHNRTEEPQQNSRKSAARGSRRSLQEPSCMSRTSSSGSRAPTVTVSWTTPCTRSGFYCTVSCATSCARSGSYCTVPVPLHAQRVVQEETPCSYPGSPGSRSAPRHVLDVARLLLARLRGTAPPSLPSCHSSCSPPACPPRLPSGPSSSALSQDPVGVPTGFLGVSCLELPLVLPLALWLVRLEVPSRRPPSARLRAGA